MRRSTILAIAVLVACSARFAGAATFVVNPTDPVFDTLGEGGEIDLTGVETDVSAAEIEFKVNFNGDFEGVLGSLQLDIVSQTSNKSVRDVEPKAVGIVPDFVLDALDVDYFVKLGNPLAPTNTVELVNAVTSVGKFVAATFGTDSITFSLERSDLGNPTGDVHYGAIVGDSFQATDYLDQDASNIPTMGLVQLGASDSDPIPEPASVGVWFFVVVGGSLGIARARKSKRAESNR